MRIAIIAFFITLIFSVSPSYASNYDDYYPDGYSAYYDNDNVDSYERNYSYYDDNDNYQPAPRHYQRQGRRYYNSQNSYSNHSNSYSRSESSHSGGSLPSQISAPGEKVIIIDPRVHAWGAYAADGTLLRSGVATAGGNYCRDIGRSCRTRSGSFRIFSLGSSSCKSHRYPRPHGGAPMPYCMFFNKNQGLHGSYEVVRGNISHGCVRVHVDDAYWIRFNFANIGTKIIVRPY